MPDEKPGVALAASSLSPDDDELRYWNQEIAVRISADHPYPSLCYRVGKNGRAALMHRTCEQANKQLEFVHVLIGSSKILTPDLALGSFRWNWPDAIRSRDLFMSKLLDKVFGASLDGFLRTARAEYADLIRNSQDLAAVNQLIVDAFKYGGPDNGPLQPSSKEFLSLGTRKFLVLTDENGTLAVHILAGLISALESYDFIGDGFSTHEKEYDAQTTLPRWVFATSWNTTSSFPVGRRKVDLQGIEVKPRESTGQAAKRYIELYRQASLSMAKQAPGESLDPEMAPAQDASQAPRPATPPPAELAHSSTLPPPSGYGTSGKPTFTPNPDIKSRLFEESPVDSGQRSAATGGSSEFDGLSDGALLDRLAIIESDQISSIAQEIRRRAASDYQDEQRQKDNPVDIRAVRAQLDKMGFYAYSIDRVKDNWRSVADLYRAICEFAVSDQPRGDVERSVAEQLLLHRAVMPEVEYSLLRAAAARALWPPTGEGQDSLVPHQVVSDVERLLGHEVMERSGIRAEAAPEVHDHSERPPDENPPVLSTKIELAVLLASVVVVLVAVCIGFLL
jgi:hypothetical protein